MIVVLDTGPLGLATNPNRKNIDAHNCAIWLANLIRGGATICIPEIADYDLRRELLRLKRTNAIQRLDQLQKNVEYLKLSTEIMRNAAQLWANARNLGIPTAHDKAIDGDMILVAQAQARTNGDQVVIATVDLGDLPRFAPAKKWQDITV